MFRNKIIYCIQLANDAKNLIVFLFILLNLTISITLQAQSKTTKAWADSLLLELRTNQTLDALTKSNLADSVFSVSANRKDVCTQVYARAIQSTSLDQLGMPDSALAQLYWAQNHFVKGCDSLTYFIILANLTNIFLSIGENDRIEQIGRLALQHPTISNFYIPMVTILNNLAIAYVLKGDTTAGINTFKKLFTEASRSNDKINSRSALINLGAIKAMQNDLDSAYTLFQTAADPRLKSEDIISYMDLQVNLSEIEIARAQYKLAAIRLDSLSSLNKRIGKIEIDANILRSRADIYAQQHQYSDAYKTILMYIETQEKLLNEERVQAVAEMMEKFESEKKARQIKDLEVLNLDATLQNVRISNTRNRFMYAGAGILLIAIGSIGRLQYVRRAKHAIQKEKDISEGLLLNILPATVANELKINGRAKAKSYDLATILFSDFKNFTTISSDMSAEDIVDEINVCFQAFDEIMAQYGLEKIKTIGDAYMAAGAVPDDNKAEAVDVIHAALAMQEFITTRKKIRDEEQQPGFEMRIGIHTGPVVAGIVGIKKFQYDLWGDTVNIASRMETNGEPGQVNISATTYDLVKNDPVLSFTSRGMIEVKGKGEMIMYFVTRQQQAVA